MVLVVSVDEHLNKATGLIGEAKAILEDPAVREQMRINSYLGGMEELTMYKQALAKAEEAVAILTKYQGAKLPVAIDLVCKLRRKIVELENPPKPVEEKPVLKSIKETVKKVKKSKGGKK